MLEKQPIFNQYAIDKQQKWRKLSTNNHQLSQLLSKVDKHRKTIQFKKTPIKNATEPFDKSLSISIQLPSRSLKPKHSLKQQYRKLKRFFNKSQIDLDHNFIGESYYKQITQQKAQKQKKTYKSQQFMINKLKKSINTENNNLENKSYQTKNTISFSNQLIVSCQFRKRIQRKKYKNINFSIRRHQSPQIKNYQREFDDQYSPLQKRRYFYQTQQKNDENLPIQPWDQIYTNFNDSLNQLK